HREQVLPVGRLVALDVDRLEDRAARPGQVGDLAPGARLDLARQRAEDGELLGDGPAQWADVLGGEARIGAQLQARVEVARTAHAEVDVVLDDERVRPERVAAGAAPAAAAPAAAAPGPARQIAP